MRKYQKEVSQGIKLCDKVYPAWLGKINLDELDLFNPHYCILGQIGESGDYFKEKESLFFSMMGEEPDDRKYGFNLPSWDQDGFQELTEEWKRQIISRRNRRAKK